MSYPVSRVQGPPGGIGPARICHAITLGLGVVIFFLGFATLFSYGSGQTSYSYYSSVGTFVVPAFFLLGGLLALPGLLPRSGGAPGVLPIAATVPASLGQLFTTFAWDSGGGTERGVGFILILVFGLLQMTSAIVGYLLEIGVISPAARATPYGPPPGYLPPGGYAGGPAPVYPHQPGPVRHDAYGQQAGFAPHAPTASYGPMPSDPTQVRQPSWYEAGPQQTPGAGERPQG